MGISVVSCFSGAYRELADEFVKYVPKWCEIVIVSDKEYKNDRVTNIVVGVEYNYGKYMNIGIRNAKNDELVIMDIDMRIDEMFYKAEREKWECLLPFVARAKEELYAYRYELSGTHWDKPDFKMDIYNAYGCFRVDKDIVYRIGGFDESMSGWGAVDADFTNRIIMAGGKVRWLPIFALHQWHGFIMPTEDKGKSKNIDKLISNYENKIINPNGDNWGLIF